MKLVPWDPFSDVDSLFNRMMPRMLANWPRMGLSAEGREAAQWSPSADISETDKEYLIRAELPAVKKEDVTVTVDDGTITIEGERKQQREDKSEKYHRVESFHGTFTRRFALPDDIDAKSITCEDKDGVLTIHIPKAAVEKKSKPIEIKVQ
jgi:HSP20 family protein